jgi:hypothetical protein
MMHLVFQVGQRGAGQCPTRPISLGIPAHVCGPTFGEDCGNASVSRPRASCCRIVKQGESILSGIIDRCRGPTTLLAQPVAKSSRLTSMIRRIFSAPLQWARQVPGLAFLPLIIIHDSLSANSSTEESGAPYTRDEP